MPAARQHDSKPASTPLMRRQAQNGRVTHLLIIGVNYWPETTGIAPYTTALAEHFAASGQRVTVLTGMPSYPQWRVFDGYRGRWQLREQARGVDLHRIRHHVPSRQSAWRRGLYEATFMLHSLRSMALARPDAVIGVVPALGGGVAARLAAARFNVPYGLIFQDLMAPASGQSGVEGGSRVTRVTRAAEGFAVRRAAAVAAISEGFFPYLEALGVSQERLIHLPNWVHVGPATGERAGTRRRLGWSDDAYVVLHAGNMGLKQGLGQEVEAARLADRRALPIRFVLMGDGSQRGALEQEAEGLANCSFLDPVHAADFPDVLAAADALLLSERASVADMCLPSKLTSYFAAGRPVIAATPLAGATARELERSGAALVVAAERPAALLDAIECLAADAGLAGRLAAAGRDYARQYLSEAAAFSQADLFVQAILGFQTGEPARARPVEVP